MPDESIPPGQRSTTPPCRGAKGSRASRRYAKKPRCTGSGMAERLAFSSGIDRSISTSYGLAVCSSSSRELRAFFFSAVLGYGGCEFTTVLFLAPGFIVSGKPLTTGFSHRLCFNNWDVSCTAAPAGVSRLYIELLVRRMVYDHLLNINPPLAHRATHPDACSGEI